jgi:hypothetical protein
MMNISEIAPYAAIAATIVVWSLTQKANRKHEIFKERLKRRVEMFETLLPEISRFVDAVRQFGGNESNAEAVRACQDAINKLGSYRVKMLCYGTNEEQRVYEEFIDAIENHRMDVLSERNERLVNLVRKNLRSELGIK